MSAIRHGPRLLWMGALLVLGLLLNRVGMMLLNGVPLAQLPIFGND